MGILNLATKALVLNSGGCDSSVAVSIAVDRFGKDNVSTVSCYYGSRHNDNELKRASWIAKYYKLKHYEFDLSSLYQYSDCSLLKQSSELPPEMSYAEQIAKNGEGKVSTYVPFRNGLLLSVVAALAQAIYPNDRCYVYYGAHSDDAAGNAYADCSPEFAEAMNEAINIGTYGLVSVERPFVNINKAQVVAWGLELGTPFELTWSCYNSGEIPCGKCGTCIDRAAAFAANGIEDPALNENKVTETLKKIGVL